MTNELLESFYINHINQKIKCNGQAFQDLFVLSANKYKNDGYFIEIGSAWPIHVNNTFILEHYFNWKGIMIEYNKEYLQSYILHRSNSIHVMEDATLIDYKSLFANNNVPQNVDYLQIDLEVSNKSTITLLEIFDKDIFDKYTFGVITFEHDYYTGDYYDTRYKSRQILHKRGYVLLYPDISLYSDTDYKSFEDWWVHPDLIDSEYIKKHYNKVNNHNYANYVVSNIVEFN